MAQRLETVDLGRPVTRLCPECGAAFTRALVPFTYEGRRFGYFPADVCKSGHEYFTEESRGAIQVIAKALGLWGSTITSTVQSVYSVIKDKTLEWAEVLYRFELTPSVSPGIELLALDSRSKTKVAASSITG